MDRRLAANLACLPLVLMLAACQYLGAAPSTSSPSSPSSPSPAPSPTTHSSFTAPVVASPASSPSLSTMDAADLRMRQQAEVYLARWARVAADAPPDAIVFTEELTRGGGWHGRHADDKKTAFLSGLVEATVALPTEAPPPGVVTWADGSTQSVELFSAAEALDDLSSHMDGGECPGCTPLEVIGAKLVDGAVETARGPARAPVWEFEFASADAPLAPITHVAVRDRIVVEPSGEWDPYGDSNPIGTRIDAAYGSRSDTELVVLFVGAPWTGESWCGADYTAEAVESDLAVVVIVHGTNHPPVGSTPPPACRAVGHGRTAVVRLAAPLGDRAVLEVQFGTPVPLRPGPAPRL